MAIWLLRTFRSIDDETMLLLYKTYVRTRVNILQFYFAFISYFSIFSIFALSVLGHHSWKQTQRFGP